MRETICKTVIVVAKISPAMKDMLMMTELFCAMNVGLMTVLVLNKLFLIAGKLTNPNDGGSNAKLK